MQELPQPEIEPLLPPFETSLNHWTTREIKRCFLNRKKTTTKKTPSLGNYSKNLKLIFKRGQRKPPSEPGVMTPPFPGQLPGSKRR